MTKQAEMGGNFQGRSAPSERAIDIAEGAWTIGHLIHIHTYIGIYTGLLQNYCYYAEILTASRRIVIIT